MEKIQAKDPYILIVEDNPVDYEITTRALRKAELNQPIHHCEDGDEALAFLMGVNGELEEKGCPSLILLDLNLPGTNGRDVLKKIKAHNDLKKIPVIVLTTSNNEHDIDICYEQGANSYIKKPIKLADYVEMATAIETLWLYRSRLPGEHTNDTTNAVMPAAPTPRHDGHSLRNLKFFENLPEDDIRFLQEAGTFKTCPKQSTIFLQGDTADHLFIVIDGWIKLYNSNTEGDESGIRMLTCGDIFGVDALFTNKNYNCGAEAISDSVIWKIKSLTLLKGMKSRFELTEQFINILAQEVREWQIASSCSSIRGAGQRVACLLLRLSSWMTGKGGTFKFPYKKSVAATQIGMDQATFSRALTRLEELGVTSKEGEISIREFSALSEYCCRGCPFSEGLCDGSRLSHETDKP